LSIIAKILPGNLLEKQIADILKNTKELNKAIDNTTGAVKDFTKIAFPIVRRVFGGLVAPDLISVRPLLPTIHQQEFDFDEIHSDPQCSKSNQ